jgi:hypothetical protein
MLPIVSNFTLKTQFNQSFAQIQHNELKVDGIHINLGDIMYTRKIGPGFEMRKTIKSRSLRYFYSFLIFFFLVFLISQKQTRGSGRTLAAASSHNIILNKILFQETFTIFIFSNNLVHLGKSKIQRQLFLVNKITGIKGALQTSS